MNYESIVAAELNAGGDWGKLTVAAAMARIARSHPAAHEDWRRRGFPEVRPTAAPAAKASPSAVASSTELQRVYAAEITKRGLLESDRYDLKLLRAEISKAYSVMHRAWVDAGSPPLVYAFEIDPAQVELFKRLARGIVKARAMDPNDTNQRNTVCQQLREHAPAAWGHWFNAGKPDFMAAGAGGGR